VLDYNGERAFRLFRFGELQAPIMRDAARSSSSRNGPFDGLIQ
jgi:hypothetical protein